MTRITSCDDDTEANFGNEELFELFSRVRTWVQDMRAPAPRNRQGGIDKLKRENEF